MCKSCKTGKSITNLIDCVYFYGVLPTLKIDISSTRERERCHSISSTTMRFGFAVVSFAASWYVVVVVVVAVIFAETIEPRCTWPEWWIQCWWCDALYRTYLLSISKVPCMFFVVDVVIRVFFFFSICVQSPFFEFILHTIFHLILAGSFLFLHCLNLCKTLNRCASITADSHISFSDFIFHTSIKITSFISYKTCLSQRTFGDRPSQHFKVGHFQASGQIFPTDFRFRVVKTHNWDCKIESRKVPDVTNTFNEVERS